MKRLCLFKNWLLEYLFFGRFICVKSYHLSMRCTLLSCWIVKLLGLYVSLSEIAIFTIDLHYWFVFSTLHHHFCPFQQVLMGNYFSESSCMYLYHAFQLIIACKKGGTSIEDLAEKFPDLIIKVAIQISFCVLAWLTRQSFRLSLIVWLL